MCYMPMGDLESNFSLHITHMCERSTYQLRCATHMHMVQYSSKITLKMDHMYCSHTFGERFYVWTLQMVHLESSFTLQVDHMDVGCAYAAVLHRIW